MLCYDILEMIGQNINYKRNYIRCIQELNNKFDDVNINDIQYNERYFIYNYFFHLVKGKFINNIYDDYEDEIDDYFFYKYLLERVKYKLEEYKFGKITELESQKKAEIMKIIHKFEKENRFINK